jgi:DNA-binding NtrC family response regulator
LDELGEMSLRMQAVLLRFAETGEIQPIGSDTVTGRTDVRLITATNRDLRKQIEIAQFREDLYYRLNVIQIWVPPLRQRSQDVLLLLRHYLQRASESHRLPLPELTVDAERALLAYAWPGNIRELKNVTERIVVRASNQPISRDQLPREIIGERQASVVPISESLGEGSKSHLGSRQPVRPSDAAGRLWERLLAGEDFWAVVHQPFKAHELTRDDLAALIDRGLQHTRGSYRALLATFGLPTSDYKRFHAFLYQQNCNLPVGPYRAAKTLVRGTERADGPATSAAG